MKLGRIDHEGLTEERSLWEIFRKSWVIQDSRFNAWSIGIVGGIGALYSFGQSGNGAVLKLLHKQAELGFNSAVQLLGFLIAGFTIFAGCSKSELLLDMAKFKEPKSGLVYLKYNFFLLVRVFIWLLAFAAFELIVIVFGQEEGATGVFLLGLGAPRALLDLGTSAALTVGIALWAVVFAQIKSFVFNVYHFAMTMVRYDARTYNRSREFEE